MNSFHSESALKSELRGGHALPPTPRLPQLFRYKNVLKTEENRCFRLWDVQKPGKIQCFWHFDTMTVKKTLKKRGKTQRFCTWPQDCPTLAQCCAKMAPCWPKMATCWPKMVPKMAFGLPHNGLDGPMLCQDGPTLAQDGHMLAQGGTM